MANSTQIIYKEINLDHAMEAMMHGYSILDRVSVPGT
ncbi:hypothetical protein A2U01_0079201, partial [Trifolium medium]|nr:hypothetical protein [Trifolium medium]